MNELRTEMTLTVPAIVWTVLKEERLYFKGVRHTGGALLPRFTHQRDLALVIKDLGTGQKVTALLKKHGHLNLYAESVFDKRNPTR